MKISPQWLRDFIDLRVDPNQLADELTLAGIAVESVTGEGDAVVFEMEITTNRPDAMNHYGVAREAAATDIQCWKVALVIDMLPTLATESPGIPPQAARPTTAKKTAPSAVMLRVIFDTTRAL